MKKSIYIKDEDIAVFEEAAALGGDNLSGVIADAVKQYVEKKKAEKRVILEVGTWPAQGAADIKRISFKGRLLADIETDPRDDKYDYGTRWQIYQTKRGNYVLYWRKWTIHEDEPIVADYTVLDDLPERGTEYEGEISFSRPVPGGLVEKAGETMGRDTVEHLDI